MDLRSYCDNVQTELTGWKAKVYDIVRKFDKLHSVDKEKVVPMVQDLHMIVEELSDRIDRLEKECPTEWEPEKIEIQGKIGELKTTWEGAWKNVAPGDFGG